MNERFPRARDVSKKALKAVGRGAVKASAFAAQELRAYQERWKLKDISDTSAKLAESAFAAGGFVKDEQFLANERIHQENHIRRRYSGLESAASLALRAAKGVQGMPTENGEVFQIGSATISKNSDGSIEIQSQRATDYTLIKNLDDAEWRVRTTAVVDPETNVTTIPCYGKLGTDYIARDSEGNTVSIGSTSYWHAGNPPQSTTGFDRALEYIDEAAKEIGYLAYHELIFQGVTRTDEIRAAYENAILQA